MDIKSWYQGAGRRARPPGPDAGAFEADPALRDALLQALDRMLTFYGLRRLHDAACPEHGRRAGTRIEIDDARFLGRARTWLHPGNHNHLRLTRILQSLSALGLADEARALQRCLLADVAEGPAQASSRSARCSSGKLLCSLDPRRIDFARDVPVRGERGPECPGRRLPASIFRILSPGGYNHPRHFVTGGSA